MTSLDWFAVHGTRNFWQTNFNTGETGVRVTSASSPSKRAFSCGMPAADTAHDRQKLTCQSWEEAGRPSSSAVAGRSQAQKADASAPRVRPEGSYLPVAWLGPGSPGLLNSNSHLSVFVSLVHWGIKDWLQVTPWLSVLRWIRRWVSVGIVSYQEIHDFAFIISSKLNSLPVTRYLHTRTCGPCELSLRNKTVLVIEWCVYLNLAEAL